MREISKYLKEAKKDTLLLSTRRLRHCSALIDDYVTYCDTEISVLWSFGTEICLKYGNLYIVADSYCSKMCWQYVNKFIQDTRSATKAVIICYIDNTRTDRTYIKYMFSTTSISFKRNEIIPEGAILPALADFYKTFAIWLYNYFNTIKLDGEMNRYGHDINGEGVKTWFGL